jgi:phage baseplate assembly protein gpV
VRRIPGVIVARVKKVEDDQGEGRVRIQYPWMEGNKEGPLVPIATLMSGGGRGSWFMPEAGDEVLVAFDNGEVDSPYIVGCLWNGVDKPPTDGINENVRRIQTTSGHRIDLDDNKGKEKIVVETQGHNRIEMNDSGTPKVTIETPGHQTVELDDDGSKIKLSAAGHTITLQPAPSGASSANISLQTAGGASVMLTDLPSGIGISCPTGMFTLTCQQATINASSALMVNAPSTIFSGTVMATAITTTSMLSPTYTPGAGNFLGL